MCTDERRKGLYQLVSCRLGDYISFVESFIEPNVKNDYDDLEQLITRFNNLTLDDKLLYLHLKTLRVIM